MSTAIWKGSITFGLAKLTMHQREYTVFVRPRKQGLTLHTMFYSNEIADIAEYGKHDETKLNPQEVKLAEQLVETLAADFNPRQYRDEFQERLRALIAAKSKGKSILVAPQLARGKKLGRKSAGQSPPSRGAGSAARRANHAEAAAGPLLRSERIPGAS